MSEKTANTIAAVVFTLALYGLVRLIIDITIATMPR